MIWIELIGPSGVGKSYYFKKLIDKNSYLRPEHILIKRIKQSKEYLASPIYIKLLYVIIMLKIPKLKTVSESLFINHFSRYLFNKDLLVNYEKYEEIVNTFLMEVAKIPEPKFIVMKKIELFSKTLNRFILYCNYFKENDIYIAEDGLQHLSPTFLNNFKPTLFIILKADKKKIIKQRLNRAKVSPTTLIEKIYNEKKLLSYLEDYYFENYNRKLQIIKKTVPTISISISDENNVIRNIENEISKLKKRCI